MPNSTTPSHTSLHFGLFEDDCVESDATNNAADREDEHTLTAFGEVSLGQEEMFEFDPNNIRRRNRMRLKERRRSAQYSPQIPGRKFWDPLTSSLVSTPLTPAEFFNGFRHSVRRAFQLAQAEAADAEARSRATDSGESASSDLSASDDYKLGQSVIVKDIPEQVKEKKKLTQRPVIPKWELDD
ncbi:uncharacterized protein BJ212DRAFT_1538538 [Suillus subaureus]|uniref:Uncharacterized protein n=1 Tax=Suillus subaureus TaxID=48587 RepID=A0A9P7DY13_9AGAM|nr:uncharacterized protein BJ212DRAFT_1538538 [Suillus subaureus]KAG1806178.1 hypothetical protein BJ212DRAFT_1538538 [Suillus subaureus]